MTAAPGDAVAAAPGDAVAAASIAQATVMPAAPIPAAAARIKPMTQALTPERRARLEYLTLMLRQLLFKYGLDKGDKLKSIVQ